MERSKVMRNKKEYLINSCIVGFLVSGIITNGFCIYVSLVFNENNDLVNKILFTICGVLFVIFLTKKGCGTLGKIKYKVNTVREILREIGITLFLSILWMIPLWMIWAWIMSIL